jgi:hypothetical protein
VCPCSCCHGSQCPWVRSGCLHLLPSAPSVGGGRTQLIWPIGNVSAGTLGACKPPAYVSHIRIVWVERQGAAGDGPTWYRGLELAVRSSKGSWPCVRLAGADQGGRCSAPVSPSSGSLCFSATTQFEDVRMLCCRFFGAYLPACRPQLHSSIANSPILLLSTAAILTCSSFCMKCLPRLAPRVTQ